MFIQQRCPWKDAGTLPETPLAWQGTDRMATQAEVLLPGWWGSVQGWLDTGASRGGGAGSPMPLRLVPSHLVSQARSPAAHMSTLPPAVASLCPKGCSSVPLPLPCGTICPACPGPVSSSPLLGLGFAGVQAEGPPWEASNSAGSLFPALCFHGEGPGGVHLAQERVLVTTVTGTGTGVGALPHSCHGGSSCHSLCHPQPQAFPDCVL